MERYLETYDKNFRCIWGEIPKVSWSTNQGRTVFTTWKISLDAIKEQDAEAANIFILYSFLSNETLRTKYSVVAWDSVLLVCLFVARYTSHEHLALTDWRRHCSRRLSRNDFSYSLAKRNKSSRSFYIHPLVHRWTREHLDNGSQSLSLQKLFKWWK